MNRKSRRTELALLAVFILSPALAQELPPHVLAAKDGLAHRVQGSPEPPAAYRVEKALPELPIPRLITFRFEPGTGRLVYVDQAAGAKNTRVRRYNFQTKELETLLEPDEFIYGLEFHPKYTENGYLFLGTNGYASAERGNKRALIVRYTVDRYASGVIDPASAFEILQWPSQGHNGTAIAFDPNGLLYFTSGDGTGDSDTDLTGQRLDLFLAKVLRVDVDNPDPGKPYSIPKDNPFLNVPGARPETYAYGFRNPWRAAWDPNLNRLWVGQNGQDRLEQVYLVEPGANYGWSVTEGSRVFYADRQRGPTPISPPTLEHGHHESRSLTGGSVYTGSQLPDLRGAYVYGDYTTGKIWGARHDGKKVTWHQELTDSKLGLTDFVTGPDGHLWIASYQADDEGGLYRLVPNPPDPNAPVFPRKLSETGLFRALATHEMEPSVLPYDVIAPQWSDGARQVRFLALPAGDTHVGFSPRRGWEFPDGAVALQSLALGEKWVETRLLSRQQGEWVGYSYAWNEAQTDADLVPMEGMDRQVAGRTWHYASRADCMICHSRAANFVLGLQTCQLNRPLDYGNGFTANQLDVMNQLGYFKRKGAKPDAPSLMRQTPDQLDRLADPFDATQDLNLRARSYLHAACSHCHVEAGGGNAMMDLRHFIEPPAMRIFDEKPNHGTAGLPTDVARLVTPGDAAKSVMFYRIARSGPGQMPPMGATNPDPRAVTLLLEWMNSKDAVTK